MTIIFYRILGNDIPIRHRPHQTLTNLPFILKNEAMLPDGEKRFLLNRIVDQQIRQALIAAIDSAGLRWDEIPFDPSEFRALQTLDEKALYLTNQNAARNRCIDLGLADADVVLPFDGQVFFRPEGWAGMSEGLAADTSGKYFAVPMLRVRENRQATVPWTNGEDADHLWAEPQIAVRRGYDLRFNERLHYGNANKIELLMKLGVKGPWDTWDSPLYRAIRADMSAAPSPNFGRVSQAGFVFRLASGNWKAERSTNIRVHSRRLGLQEFVLRIVREHAA